MPSRNHLPNYLLVDYSLCLFAFIFEYLIALHFWKLMVALPDKLIHYCNDPPAERVTLAPLRDDVPLLDPCCGQLSAGAEVVLGLKGRKKFIDFDHVPSALWVPPGFRERPQTTPNFSVVCVDLSEDEAWNSRRIPPAALRARLSGKKQTNRSIF
uniref:Uncharacterized protein n=1 Tax=Pundamilia nyererei TaxID=303518 RepID=A0A3B4F666_9CICH